MINKNETTAENIVWHKRDTRRRESLGGGQHSGLKNVLKMQISVKFHRSQHIPAMRVQLGSLTQIILAKNKLHACNKTAIRTSSLRERDFSSYPHKLRLTVHQATKKFLTAEIQCKSNVNQGLREVMHKTRKE